MGEHLPEGGQREPEKEDKLEGKVKGEPVDNVHEVLEHGEERIDDPVLHSQWSIIPSTGKPNHSVCWEYHVHSR